jgi:hypothetical protein
VRHVARLGRNVVEAMSWSGFYPSRLPVSVRETHAAVVLLAAARSSARRSRGCA